MEGNYGPGFYCADRDQQERQPQQLQQQHQRQQHPAPYPLDLPIPYFAAGQHQGEYVEEQPPRGFPVPHPGPGLPMFRSLYHESGPVQLSPNLLHHAHHQPQGMFGGHGVKLATPSTNYAPLPVTTTREPVIERTIQTTTAPEPIADRNIVPIALHQESIEGTVPSTSTSAIESTVTTPEVIPENNVQPVSSSGSASPEPVAESIVQSVIDFSTESTIQRITPPQTQAEDFTPIDQQTSEDVEAEEAQVKETPSQETSPQPSSPKSSSDEPHVLAALMLKKNSSILQLPQNLTLKVTSEDNIEGIVAKEAIEKGVEFGPYTGTLLNEDQGRFKETSWEICITGKVFFYIDGHKTWMSHLQCAQNEEEQNLEAYQYCGDIYFRTTKVVEPGSELRVFYSEDYGKSVGIQSALKDLTFDPDAQQFHCSQCADYFTSAKLFLRHTRHKHTSRNPNEMIPMVIWKRKRKVDPLVIKVGLTPKLKSKKKGDSREKFDRDKFKCKTCKKVFRTSGRLKHHERFHVHVREKPSRESSKRKKVPSSPPKEYACDECDQVYEVRDSLSAHKRRMHGYQCRICSERFPRKHECSRHERTHEEYKVMFPNAKPVPSGPPKTYQCSECDQSYEVRDSLSRHKRKVHGYKCKYCSERLPTRSACSKHERTHSPFRTPQKEGNKRDSVDKIQPSDPSKDEVKDMLGRPSNYYQSRYKCRFCPKRYSSRITAERHEAEIHTGEGDFLCTQCPRVFASESRLKEHMIVHKLVRMYRCTLCPRSFASESALNNHQGEHTGLKPCKCEVCGRGFRNRKLALNHKRRVHMERPKRFFCTLCNKGFAARSDLKVHERRHKGIRQYVCLECGQGFSSNTSLKAHMQGKHIKEKPFACQICGKTFALNHQFNRHMAKHRLDAEENNQICNIPLPVPQMPQLTQ